MLNEKIINEGVSGYINQAPDMQRDIMKRVRRVVHDSVPGVREDLKWSRPVFRKGVDLLYLKTTGSYVIVGFFNFHKLDDPGNLLEGTGKDMRHIKIKSADELDEGLLRKWIASLAE